ncbi:hypothetical protein EHS39_13410 [Ensifer sp. MPMI2T]|nr:hypothetical protein EHS39_13410 [Ensifer sp. MPMI2T]
MMKIILSVLAALPLAGCMTGKAEFAAMEGKLTPMRLEKAKAVCRMRLRDSDANQIMAYGASNQFSLIDDASDCFAAQGIRLKGWRQDNGMLTRYPVKPLTKMAEKSLVVPE